MRNLDQTDVPPVVPDILADRIVYLSRVALLHPRALTTAEIQELAAAVVAHQSQLAERREQTFDPPER